MAIHSTPFNSICTKGNTIISKFKMCSKNVREELFKTSVAFFDANTQQCHSQHESSLQ